MKKPALFLIVFVSFLLFACSVALPPSPLVAPTLAAPTQPPTPVPTQSPVPTQMPEHPAILGKWTIDETKPLKTRYYAIDAQGGEYYLDFSFQIGEAGQKIEFARDVMIYASMAYEYQSVDSQRIRTAVNIGFTGTVWLVYDVKLDGGKLSLLDDRDGTTLVVLSKP